MSPCDSRTICCRIQADSVVCGSDRRRVRHRPSASRHLPGTGVVIPELDSTRRFYKVSFFAGERGSVVNDAFSMNGSSVSFRHLGVTQLVRIMVACSIHSSQTLLCVAWWGSSDGEERETLSWRIVADQEIAAMSRFKYLFGPEDRIVFDDLLTQCRLYAA